MALSSPSMQYSAATLRGLTPDALSEVIRGGHFDHLVIEGASLDADLERWAADGVCLDRGRYGFGTMVAGEFRSDHLCIGIASARAGETRINGISVGADHAQVYAEGADLQFRSGRDTKWSAIQVERERVQQHALSSLGREVRLPEIGMVDFALPHGTTTRLRRVQDSLLASAQAGESVESHSSMSRILIEAVVDLMSESSAPAAEVAVAQERRTRALRVALRWMREHVTSGYSSERLCAVTRTPERTLQLYFRQIYGLSPSRVHTLMRLGKLRDHLHRASPRSDSVTSIANQCGFGHLGRLSAEFRRTFGCSPSEALGAHRRP